MGNITRQGKDIHFNFKEAEVLKFQYLKIGEKFICMPVPGDDSGHGGFKGSHNVFIKIYPYHRDDFPSDKYNAVRLCDGTFSSLPAGVWVIRVQ